MPGAKVFFCLVVFFKYSFSFLLSVVQSGAIEVVMLSHNETHSGKG